jgi:CheY-like chemotaxis protein
VQAGRPADPDQVRKWRWGGQDKLGAMLWAENVASDRRKFALEPEQARLTVCSKYAVGYGAPLPRIMVVDDEPDILALLEQLLRSDPQNEVASFPSPRAALAYSREWKPDLLVTDFRMPGMSGIEMASRMKEAHRPLRVLLLTAYSGSNVAAEAEASGVVDAFCGKSAEPQDLARLVRRVLTEHR